MSEQQRQHLSELRENHLRRLRVLELQAASYGLAAPPHILIEIEDIRGNIKAVDAQLAELEQTLPGAAGFSAGTRAITILFLSADPTDASYLRLGTELREIQEKLQLAKLRDRFELHQRMSVRPTDLSQALLDVQPKIVHFSGHGTATGALCFENQLGKTHPIQPDALAALFEQFANQVTCVVLNACYSEVQAKAIAEHINYVIGMNQAIGDKAAISFSIGFYQALGAGRTIEEAYKLGCVQLKLQNIADNLTPVLIKRQKES
jgi:CHAT domain-containing protein